MIFGESPGSRRCRLSVRRLIAVDDAVDPRCVPNAAQCYVALPCLRFVAVAPIMQWKTVKANLLGKTKSIHHGHGHSHSSKPHGAGERLCFGIALERGGEQVYRVPLAGATTTPGFGANSAQRLWSVSAHVSLAQKPLL